MDLVSMNVPLTGSVAQLSATTAAERIADQATAQNAGKEFESVFMSLMIKQMRSSLESGFFSGDGSDVYGGLFDLMMGQSLSQTSPLGIQSMVTDMLNKTNGTAATSQAVGTGVDTSV